MRSGPGGASGGQGEPTTVQVLVDVPLFHLDRPFTYRVPPALRGQVTLGSRVKVPFGGRRRVDGWVVGRSDRHAAPPEDLRDLERVVSPLPAFDARGLDLLRWVADRYAATLADVLRLAVPPRVAAVEAEARAAAEAAARAAAAGGGGRAARSRGLRVVAGGTAGQRPPAGGRPAGDEPALAAVGSAAAAPRLDEDAAGRALPAVAPEPLAELAASGWPGAVWWRPLPGEDRGERIATLVETVLAAGRGVVVVVPEVVAGSAVLDALRARFPDAADLSSGSSARRRYRAWVELAEGRQRVAIGGRSAVFAPVRPLGCIVVDEEANPAHKEQRTPRYHAREVALRRAARERALCVLTGTVPSAELVAAARAGQCRLLAPDRALERALRPLVEVVNPDDEGPAGPRIHPRGIAAVRDALRRGESAYVLVPRRGGPTPQAPGTRTTGQVAAELAGVLRGVNLWRLDREMLGAGDKPPWAGEGPGVVVGTVAGVKDTPPLPACRTVVVVGADAALTQAEVRAAEDAYRTWSRAAAWCGPHALPGRMVLQTRDLGHHAVQALVRWDPVYFWRHELPRRVELRFPPARRLILFEGAEPADAEAALRGIAAALGPRAELLGPAALGRGWRIIAKVEDVELAARSLRPWLAEAGRAGGPRISVDVEPLELLGQWRARDPRDAVDPPATA